MIPHCAPRWRRQHQHAEEIALAARRDRGAFDRDDEGPDQICQIDEQAARAARSDHSAA
jgi:hypothetical protein